MNNMYTFCFMDIGVEKEVSVFFYGQSNRPVQCVDIIGIVRAIDIFRKVIKYYSKYFCSILLNILPFHIR